MSQSVKELAYSHAAEVLNSLSLRLHWDQGDKADGEDPARFHLDYSSIVASWADVRIAFELFCVWVTTEQNREA